MLFIFSLKGFVEDLCYGQQLSNEKAGYFQRIQMGVGVTSMTLKLCGKELHAIANGILYE